MTLMAKKPAFSPTTGEGSNAQSPAGGPVGSRLCEGWYSLLISHETGIYGVLGLIGALNEHDKISVRWVNTDPSRVVTSITLFVRIPLDLEAYLGSLTGVKSMIWPEDACSPDEASSERHPMVVVRMH